MRETVGLFFLHHLSVYYISSSFKKRAFNESRSEKGSGSGKSEDGFGGVGKLDGQSRRVSRVCLLPG